MDNSITNLLEELQTISVDKGDDVKEWCHKLVSFYESNERHSYSEITKYLITGGGIDYVENIISSLETLRTSPELTSSIQNKIEKLIDHLNLEVIRIRYINDLVWNKSRQSFIELNNETTEPIAENLSSLENKCNDVERSLQKTRRKVKNLQIESISILGIFAAVMLAFVGGITFSTSVLQNIHKASKYRITFITFLIGLILFDVIWVLMNFIHEIVQDTESNKKIFYIVNGLLCFGLVLTYFAYVYHW